MFLKKAICKMGVVDKQTPCMLTILRPVILVNQFIGVCPHDIEGGCLLVFNWKSPRFFKTLVTLSILTMYFIFVTLQFICAFMREKSMLILADLFCWMISTAIPIAILIVTLIRRHDFTHFFLELLDMKAHLKGIDNCMEVVYNARKFYAIYMVLALISCGLTFTKTWMNPTYEAYFLNYWSNGNGNGNSRPPQQLVLLNCIFQTYISLLSNCACAMIEVLSAALAGSTVNKIRKIQREMSLATEVYLELENMNMEKNKSKFSTNININRNASATTIKNGKFNNNRETVELIKSVVGSDPRDHPPCWYEEGESCLPSYNAAAATTITVAKIATPPNNTDTAYQIDGINNDYYNNHSSASPILIAIQKFHFIAKSQRLINCIWGFLLALNTAWLVTKVCLLWFIQIRHFGGRYQQQYGVPTTSSVFNVTSSDGDSILMSDPAAEAIEILNTSSPGIIAGRFVSIFVLIFSIRLVNLLVSLGNVHEASKWFDASINTNLTKIPKPKSTEMHLILVHLLSNQLNPVSFSAGGFFVISRGTLLYVFSIVTTYVVFMLQA